MAISVLPQREQKGRKGLCSPLLGRGAKPHLFSSLPRRRQAA
ncbi:MAG TPA: hypothetical protein VFN23_15020 [Ktedonobacteraceae bacterium]|nr:hypothetical protein [Ktedonobacteraceae bacterium]